VAVLTNRAFFIHWDKPVPLTTYLVPRGPVNWVADPAWRDQAASTTRLDCTDQCPDLRSLLEASATLPDNPLGSNATVALLEINTNCNMVDVMFASPLFVHTAPWTALWPAYARGDLYPLAFHLFKPSCALASAVADAERTLFGEAAAGGAGAAGGGGLRIGIHMRTGLDPAFEDPLRSSLAVADQARLFADSAVCLAASLAEAQELTAAAAPTDARLSTHLWRLVTGRDKRAPPHLFVMTDSAAVTTVLTAALHERAPDAAVVSLPIVDALPLTHIDHNATPDAQDHFRTFLEWSLYARVDGMVIARSMYSLQASRAACVPAIEVHAVRPDDEGTTSSVLWRGCCMSSTSWANATERAKQFCDFRPHWF
jgi:hypothetical protein